ncbi:MAG: hypothetical protein J4G11_08075 [Acidimicrobiia bacterium]|nr:hypothetical protein [Acidimicrobiia bacterium]
MRNRWWKGTLLLATLAMLAIACGDAEEEAPATTQPVQTTTTTAAVVEEPTVDLSVPPDEPKGGLIRIGATPSYDDRLWSYAASIGMDTRIGLDLEIIPFVSIPYTQLQTDEIDMLFSCQICYGTVIGEFPEYRNYLITNQYQGFVLIGRAGEAVVYEDALERLGDEEAAKAELAESFRGKEFVKTEGFPTTFERGLLENIGLNFDPDDPGNQDVEFKYYPSMEAMNFGYLSGEADYYTGNLSAQARMLYSEELAGEYVVAAPLELFGASAILYSTEGVRADWLEENPETVLRSLAIWYRASRYLDAYPEIVGEFVGEEAKDQTGGTSLGAFVTSRIMTELNYFPLLDDAKDYMFTPGEITYFGNVVADSFESGREEGYIAEGVDWQDHEVQEVWFNRLLEREDLVAWINAPLGSGVGPDGDVPQG